MYPKIGTEVRSHGYFSELLLGQVQWVIVGSDAVFSPLWTRWQTRPQKAIVHHVDKRHRSMPSFVIVPHLSTNNENIYTRKADYSS